MPSAMSYTDVHRAFLQTVSHHGTMSAKQAYKALLAIFGKHHSDESIPTEDQVPDIVASINGRIHRYDQRIIFVHYEPVSTDFYVFCNQTEAPLDRLQNCYSEPELSLFRLMLREMALAEEHRLRPIVCLNLTGQLAGKSISKVRAEELLDEWEKMGYFIQLDDHWCFGPRVVAEFERYLSTNFPEQMHRCTLCNESVFYGIQCEKCPQAFHRECMKKYLRRLTVCPGCKEMWTVAV
ncbi:non-structural maintenance of chromosomes element 1 homolog [Uranotaenia lowii]|uniref:non-structural maintenance of chromosomes element 1 homolog n=1 Tax=Uranotaenia lowii TaxID=190385 RepID=UPI002478D8D4|nr:non-structural maintenance of chromosomes element 1 homolog [Uranotaenia lowii]